VLAVSTFLLLTLAVARVTRLITRDKISQPLLRWVVRKYGPEHWFTYLLHCPFCVSVWIGFGGSAFWVLFAGISWWLWLPGALAMSYLTAPILLRFEEDE